MTPPAPKQVVVFIDAQNVYRRARGAFWPDPPGPPSHVEGQVNPLALGKELANRAGPHGPQRVLKQVRIHTGQPSSAHESRSYAANRRQIAAWEQLGCAVFPRTLRYPPDWPNSKPQEKGIDVALAIDFVAQAADCAFDVGILASIDTDLKPALEFVYSRYRFKCKLEVMAWRPAHSHGSRLSIPETSIYCHWLDLAAYQAIADPTDYNR